MTIAHASFDELRGNVRGKFFKSADHEDLYKQFPEIAGACMAINVLAGYALPDLENRVADTQYLGERYQFACLIAGEAGATRILRHALSQAEGKRVTNILIELAAQGDEHALGQLEDDMRADPEIVAELRFRNLDRRIINKYLPKPKKLAEVMYYLASRFENPGPTYSGDQLEQILPDILAGNTIEDITGLTHGHDWGYTVPYAKYCNADEKVFAQAAISRLKVLLAAVGLNGDVALPGVYIDKEKKLLKKIDRANAADKAIEAAELDVFQKYGAGFVSALDHFNDLSVDQKKVQARGMLHGCIRVGEFEFAESLLQLIDEPKERLLWVHDILKWMHHKGLPTRVNSRTNEEEPIDRFESGHLTLRDEELLAGVLAIAQVAILDVSTDLENARRKAATIEDEKLRAEAEDAINWRYSDLYTAQLHVQGRSLT